MNNPEQAPAQFGDKPTPHINYVVVELIMQKARRQKAEGAKAGTRLSVIA